MLWKKKSSYSWPDEQRLKKRFALAAAKVTLAGFLGFGAYQYYTPDFIKDNVTDTLHDNVTRPLKLDKLKAVWDRIFAAEAPQPVFANVESVNLLGAEGQGIYATQDGLAMQWFAASGRHQMIMRQDVNNEILNKWFSQLDHLREASIADKARGVDAFVDREITYKLDQETYGVREYWASALETVTRKQGDCEDFAILKYQALRYLGVPAEKAFIVVVGAKGGELDHATLMVDVSDATVLSSLRQRFAILDNDSSPNGRLIEERNSKFKPYYAMNETGMWTLSKDNPLVW